MLEALVAHPTVVQLGWTLLHSVWQGVVLAALLYLVLLLARNAPSWFRHAFAATFLLVWLALPVATFMTMNHASDSAVASPFSGLIQPIPSSGVSGDGIPSEPGAVSVPSVSTVGQSGETTDPSSVSHGFGGMSVPTFGWLLPYMAVAWLVIASLLSLRLAGSLLMVRRLRALGTPFMELQSRVDALAGSMGLGRSVRLLRSSRLDVPTVLGFLRPVILLPASAVTGLTREQLDLILAHELAHVRRHDYVLNILQGIAETLLFFHPFTWWLSRVMRLEREQACDALAIDATGTQRLAMAEALTRLEGLRSPPQPALAANGNLTIRVRQLLGYPNPVGGGGTGALLPLMGIMLFALWFAAGSAAAGIDTPSPTTIWVNVQGFPMLAEDGDPLERLDGNFGLRIMQHEGDRTRSLRVTKTTNLERFTYQVNGRDAEFTPEARAWVNNVLAETLLEHFSEFPRNGQPGDATIAGQTREGDYYALILERTPNQEGAMRSFLETIAPRELAALAEAGKPLARHFNLVLAALWVADRNPPFWFYDREDVILTYIETALQFDLKPDARALLERLAEELEDPAIREELLNQIHSTGSVPTWSSLA